MSVLHLVFDHPRPDLVVVLSGFRVSVVPGTRGAVPAVLHKVAIGGSPNLASPREERTFEFEVREGGSQDFPLHPVHLISPNRIYADLDIEEEDLSLLHFEAQIQDTGRLGKAAEHVLLERVLDPRELREPRSP